jgi:hypothetical protein
VAPIVFGDAYFYCNKILYYIINEKLRILDIYKSSKREFVISIPKLLLVAFPGLIAIEEPHVTNRRSL